MTKPAEERSRWPAIVGASQDSEQGVREMLARFGDVEDDAVFEALAEVDALRGRLETVRAGLLVRSIVRELGPSRSPQDEDRLLTAKEAAERLGCSTDWLYRNHHKLTFTVKHGKRGIRFSSKGIDSYIKQRRRA